MNHPLTPSSKPLPRHSASLASRLGGRRGRREHELAADLAALVRAGLIEPVWADDGDELEDLRFAVTETVALAEFDDGEAKTAQGAS